MKSSETAENGNVSHSIAKIVTKIVSYKYNKFRHMKIIPGQSVAFAYCGRGLYML